MKKLILTIAFISVTMLSFGQKYLSKEGEEVTMNWNSIAFSSNKTLAENLAQSADFSIYNKLLENEKLLNQLKNEEMVTVFAIVDSAFSDLKKKQKDSLFANKSGVEKMITFLAIPGRVDRNGMEVAAKNNKGKARYATLNGTELNVVLVDGKLLLQDPNGRKAGFVATNFYHKNGIFHIIDNRLSPIKK